MTDPTPADTPPPDPSELAPRFSDFVWVAAPKLRREQEFLAGLKNLLNQTGMDSQCGAPDYVVAEAVLGHLRAFRQSRIALALHEGREIKRLQA